MNYLILSLFCFNLFAQEITPTERVLESLSFNDDLDFKNLSLAIDRQLQAYQRLGLSGQIKFGQKVYAKSVLKSSLSELKSLAQKAQECLKVSQRGMCENEFSLAINQNFDIYRPLPKSTERGYGQKKAYFTSYYTPDFKGSYQRTAVFKNPIYTIPQNEKDRTLSRVEIDFDHKLANKNLEIMWVKETLFDIYFMHIQGGGRVILPDGKKTYLSFAGANGKKFELVSKYLIESGLMEREKTNYYTERAFLEEHPEHQRPTYATAPFFDYFNETVEEPHGLQGISLTEGRSLAWDNKVYKSIGVINFIKTVKTTHLDEAGKPVKVPFSRFFLAQDTGSAIRGNARSDLYWGYGEEALFVAGKLMEIGEQYFLIKK
jgi:membrane-bound lytic murein transglycosylase A